MKCPSCSYELQPDDAVLARAIDIVARRRLDRARRTRVIDSPGFYLEAVRGAVEADYRRRSQVPLFTDATVLADWIDPPAQMGSMEAMQVASRKIMDRNDASRCQWCDGTGWVDVGPTTSRRCDCSKHDC